MRPDGVNLTLMDCGAADLSCLTLCISTALIGTGALYKDLRLLAAAFLLFYPDLWPEHRKAHVEVALEEHNFAKTARKAMGAPCIIALGQALQSTMYFNMKVGGINASRSMSWQVYHPTIGGEKVDFASSIYVWHTGYFHYNLAMPDDFKPLWGDASKADAQSAAIVGQAAQRIRRMALDQEMILLHGADGSCIPSSCLNMLLMDGTLTVCPRLCLMTRATTQSW